MTAYRRARPLSMGVDVALASLAAAASFAVVAVTVVAAGSDLLIALLAAVYIVAIAVSFHLWGVAYGIPIAVAVLIAMDGNLRVDSPCDGGTLIAADIPIR